MCIDWCDQLTGLDDAPPSLDYEYDLTQAGNRVSESMKIGKDDVSSSWEMFRCRCCKAVTHAIRHPLSGKDATVEVDYATSLPVSSEVAIVMNLRRDS